MDTSNEFKGNKFNRIPRTKLNGRRWNEFAGQQKTCIKLMSEDPTPTHSPGDVSTLPLCGRMQKAVTSKCSGTWCADGGKRQEPPAQETD